jgi:PilZ domain
MSPRRFPRFEIVTLVLLTPFGSEEPFTAYSLDVSEGGMLLKTEKTVSDGALLEFCSSHFAGECEVMWSHRAGDGSSIFGIRFTSLGPRAHEELDTLLARFKRLPRSGTE